MPYRSLFIGLTTIDIQYFVDEYPEINVKIKTMPPDIYVGGPATNAAVAFSHLNGGANLLGVVGENTFTPFVKNDFEKYNVHLTDTALSEQISPVVASVVTSNNGNRNIFTHNPDKIKRAVDMDKIFTTVNPEIVLSDGFYPEFSLEFLQLSKKHGIPVVIDCGSWKPQYEYLLNYTDIAICSADFYPPGCASSDDIFNYMNGKGVHKVAISRGEKSILFKNHTIEGEIDIEQTKIVDTLGAGDFLHGAFCYYFLHHNNFQIALEKAAYIATTSCKHKGTRKWLINQMQR